MIIYFVLTHCHLTDRGVRMQAMDLMDERSLSSREMSCLVRDLLGVEGDLPDPEGEWDEFERVVCELSGREALQFDPVSNSMKHWIKPQELKAAFDPSIDRP